MRAAGEARQQAMAAAVRTQGGLEQPNVAALLRENVELQVELHLPI